MKLEKPQTGKYPVTLYLNSDNECFGDAIIPLLRNKSILGIQILETETEEGDSQAQITFYSRKQIWESIILLNNDINECLQGYIDSDLTGEGLVTDSLSDLYLQQEIVNCLTKYQDPYQA